jgi:hypothetical protein
VSGRFDQATNAPELSRMGREPPLARDHDSRSQRGLTNARILTLRILRLSRVHRLSSFQQRVRLATVGPAPVRQPRSRAICAEPGGGLRLPSAAPPCLVVAGWRHKPAGTLGSVAPAGTAGADAWAAASGQPTGLPPQTTPLPQQLANTPPAAQPIAPRRLPPGSPPDAPAPLPSAPSGAPWGMPPLRHPRSALPQGRRPPARPCHSTAAHTFHRSTSAAPGATAPAATSIDPASPPPPRPVQQALWERLRQYRFRPHAPSATQLPPPRPPVHCAVSPAAAVIRCSWPVVSVPPSTPSPTWTSASSG